MRNTCESGVRRGPFRARNQTQVTKPVAQASGGPHHVESHEHTNAKLRLASALPPESRFGRSSRVLQRLPEADLAVSRVENGKTEHRQVSDGTLYFAPCSIARRNTRSPERSQHRQGKAAAEPSRSRRPIQLRVPLAPCVTTLPPAVTRVVSGDPISRATGSGCLRGDAGTAAIPESEN